MIGYRDAIDFSRHKLEKPFLWRDFAALALRLLPSMSIEGCRSMRVEVKLPPTSTWKKPSVGISLADHGAIFA